MAFGSLKGALTGSLASITASANNMTNAGISVSVGDLVFAVVGQQTNLTTTGCSDNLGNTYTAVDAGTDAGAVTARAFYARVTTAGTLTTVTAAATASSNDFAGVAAVIEGPFATSPLDAHPANITSDITSPFNCPATGTLAQADEVVIGWGAANQNTSWGSVEPNSVAANANQSTNVKVVVGYQAVSATTSVVPVFTAASNPTQAILGTASFLKDLTQALTPGLFTNINLTFVPPTVAFGPLTAGLVSNSVTFYAPSVSVLGLSLLPPLFINQSGTGGLPVGLLLSLTGGSSAFFQPSVANTPLSVGAPLFTNSSTFFSPTGGQGLTPGVFNATTGGAAGSPLGLLLVVTSNASQFFQPAITQALGIAPDGAVTNAQTFYAPTLTTSTMALSAGLVSNAQTFYGPTLAGGSPSQSGFSWYGTATVDPTKCGTINSSNFPIYVTLLSDDLKTLANGGKVSNDNGYDIVWFADIDRTIALPFEIESYNGATGAYKAYVKVPTLSVSAPTVLYFAYGNRGINLSQESVSSVWSNGFVAVYHLEDGVTLNTASSVTSAPPLTNTNSVAATTGLVGLGAGSFNGTSNSLESIGGTPVISSYPFTLEGWIKPASLSNGRPVVNLGESVTGGTAYNIHIRSTGAVRAIAGGAFATTTAVLTTNTIHYVTGVFDTSSSRTIYLDAANAVTNTTAGPTPGIVDDLSIGCQDAAGVRTFFFPGVIDEVRISNVSRSQSWITATYNNLGSPSTFTTNAYGNAIAAPPTPTPTSPSRLILRRPKRTTPPALTGSFSDILISPALPIVAAGIPAGSLIVDLAAVGINISAVAWTLVDGAEVSLSGSQILRSASGTLTPNTPFMFTVKCTASGAGSFQKSFSVNVYDVPGTISLGSPGADQSSTIVSNAATGTSLGQLTTLPANGGVLATPLTYSVTVNTDFSIGSDGTSLVRGSSGTLVDPESTTVRVTDANSVTHDEVIAVEVTAPPAPTAPTRFEVLPLPTPKIYLFWRGAGDPTTGVVTEGAAGSWEVQSTDCPLIASTHGNVATYYASRDAIRRAAIAAGYTLAAGGFTYVHATDASPTGYTGPYYLKGPEIKADPTVAEYIGYQDTGFIDAGYGPSNVKLWDPPYFQFKQVGGAANNQFFDLEQGVHGQSQYRMHGIRYGLTREEEAAATITVFNVPGGTTTAECTLPTQLRSGQGLALIEAAHQFAATHCEATGSLFQGIHSTKRLRSMRQSGVLQLFDNKFTNNGDVGTEHNTYLGDTAHAVMGYNFLALPSGHNIKFDNQQRADIFENSIWGYDPDNVKYGRTTDVKVFKGTVDSGTKIRESALRQIPASAPYTIDILSWVDDQDTTVVPSVTLVPYFTNSSGSTNLGNLTVLTSGSPAQGQTTRAVVGSTSTNKANNTAVATFTFNSADAGRWVRIQGRGFGALRGDTQGGGINFDNSNVDFAIWNNMVHAFMYSAATPAVVRIQGRFQGADTRHRKMPSYGWDDSSLRNQMELISVQGSYTVGADGLEEAGEPKTFASFCAVTNGTRIFQLQAVDFIYPAMWGSTPHISATDKGPIAAGDGKVYDCEVRLDSGVIWRPTMTIDTLVKTRTSGTADFWVTFSEDPPSTISCNSDHRNVVIFKLSAGSGGSATWDRPLMTTASQRDWFDRTATHYYPYTVTFPSDRSKLDFSKQEPSVSGLPYGIPFGYMNNNLTILQKAPNNIETVTLVDSDIVQSFNVCFSTRFSSDDTGDYRIRMWFPPQNSSDGVAWADQAYAGSATWRLQTRAPTYTGGAMFFTEATDGVGIENTDMLRFNVVVQKENGVFDYHMANALQKVKTAGNVGNQTAVNTLFNTIQMYPDLRFIPNDNTTTVDENGCVKFTLNDKSSFPASYDKGKPIICIAPYGSSSGSVCIQANNGAGPYDRCRIKTLSGGTPAVNDVVQLECDGQFGSAAYSYRGGALHNAVITSVTTINATDFDIIFTPGLPQVGDSDPIFGTVSLGHEKGLSANTDTTGNTVGGRGVFMKPARLPLPSWWLNPTDIPDAA